MTEYQFNRLGGGVRRSFRVVVGRKPSPIINGYEYHLPGEMAEPIITRRGHRLVRRELYATREAALGAAAVVLATRLGVAPAELNEHLDAVVGCPPVFPSSARGR